MAGRLTVTALVAGFVLTACGDDSTSTPVTSADTAPATASGAGGQAVIDPGDQGEYAVAIDPADFTADVTNPFLPLRPGTRWVYRATSPDGEVEVITVEVLDEHRTVMGVDAVVVHDVVATEDGETVEDTYDWYAQDSAGNVWYFGEDTTAYEDGVGRDDGSWEAGVDGALPGIAMPADPQPSDTGYRQEYLAGQAEDMGQVIAVDVAIDVPAGRFEDTVRTRDWTPLEPDVIEEKTYASGVGSVHERKVAGDNMGEETVLVEFTPGA